MRINKLSYAVMVLTLLCLTMACSGTGPDTGNQDNDKESTPSTPSTSTPVTEEYTPPAGYTRQANMKFSSELVDKAYDDINTYVKKYGFDYTEHPNSSDADHKDGVHARVLLDKTLDQYVLELTLHCNADVIDGDRGKLVDRMRNELKSRTGDSYHQLNANWDEWQIIRWKMFIPKGFRPTTSFCHIFQWKAQEGNNSSPLITITLRSNSDGSNRRLQLIHVGDASATNAGTYDDNHPLEEFEDQWVQVEMEGHFTHSGCVNCKITRLSDNKVLVNSSKDNIDMWRKGAIDIRNKFGIYRSYGSTLNVQDNPTARPTNGLKDESLRLADFQVYEKNTNANPIAHD